MPDTNRALEFCMGFVAHSEKHRQQFVEKWEEVISNYMVQPDWLDRPRGQKTPYRRSVVYGVSKDQIILKDPETHKLVNTFSAKLVRALFSDRRREYVSASPVGYEDADAAQTVTRLLRYAFARPGHFRTLSEAITDMLLFGTSIIEVSWKYEEREMLVREVESDMGIETMSETRVNYPVYDDVCYRVIDPFDFYYDPGRYRLQEMSGCAKRFRMNAAEARRLARGGKYDGSAVESAVAGHGSSQGETNHAAQSVREGRDQPENRGQHSDFRDMIGYEYWGEVPWDEEGYSRRVITVLNNHVVRDRPWPLADYALPFISFIINPVQGRFYGISPAEVVRYDQSFADALKILLAEAIIRRVHPPIAYDPDSDIDISKVKAWKADSMIPVRGGPNSIGTLKYDVDINGAFSLWQGLVQNIQTSAGAPGGIQGEEGPDREAASVGVQRMQAALDQPELAAMVLEEECLPQLAQATLRRYQQFLMGTEDLSRRVGELPQSAWIGNIMGDFDITFTGSRKAMSRQMKLQGFDRLTAMAVAMPALAARLPMDQLGEYIIGDLLELPEVAAKMSDPMQMLQNMLMMQAAGGGGGAGKNGVPSSSEPAGMLPAQSSGGVP